MEYDKIAKQSANKFPHALACSSCSYIIFMFRGDIFPRFISYRTNFIDPNLNLKS